MNCIRITNILLSVHQIPDVDIDSKGRFKYILIHIKDNEAKGEKYIVRGYKSCSFHGDIFDSVEPNITKLNCKVECVGGGRIRHDPDTKSIFIYGYSQGFGRADHSIAQKLLKEKYPDYTEIQWSNEGY